MNKYVEISKRFVCSILNANLTTDAIVEIIEINRGDNQLLLEHLKAITSIMNNAINELESKYELRKSLEQGSDE